MDKIIVISYVPMLAPPDPEHIFMQGSEIMNAINPILEDMDKVENMARAVMWTYDAEPIFMIKHARIVAKHIEFWSENDPTSWFEVHWAQQDSRYALVLMPSIEKSIERFKNNYKTLKGEDIPENIGYQVLFKAISFASMNSDTFNKIKNKLPDRTRVGFVENLQDEIYWLSDEAKFKIKRKDNSYMRSLFKEDEE